MTTTNNSNHSICADFGRRISLFSLLILASLLALPALADGDKITGRAFVIDGDTISIDQQSIRLYAIDAPEKNQICRLQSLPVECGQEAAALLKEHIGRRKVTCVTVTPQDRYGRIVSRCSVKGEDLGRFMVQAGYALAYRRYGTDYVKDEDQAREALRGLWAEQFEAPWNWRKKN